ncbi:transcriptional regulator [Paenibacillus lutimineralis]|uniref:Transcriptional regulator n=1 Tax=Paenibacillus lutimineralis TaxID=2707005 RepID=A0A3Q9I7W3_9BACL|nr:transcriptional regulator [Paenibacillus lutimineralis]AZS14709.1 transcriptional regulator [Paenibacillus lutimineralis]
MSLFIQTYEEWLHRNIVEEDNPRRRELLEKGLTHSTYEFLRLCWYPSIGNLDNLHPEWEVRDMKNAVRYLDLAYMPGGAKGCIEIQDYRSHARDIGVTRFKDLCMKHSMLALDDWTILPIAYLSIVEEPKVCRQLILAFIGKFISTSLSSDLDWAEAETLRFARRFMHSFSAVEIADHLRLSDRHTRRVLHGLVERNLLMVTNRKQRYRTYQLATESVEVSSLTGVCKI